MRRLTQTRSDNCWQTCVAALLDLPAEHLPAQHEFSKREDYCLALRVFLDRHYGLTYVEIETSDEKFKTVRSNIAGAYHVLIGESKRTTRENDTWHAIVGFGGEPFWDVNADRTGLTNIHAWGLLVPTPSEWRSMFTGDCLCGDCRHDSRLQLQGLSVQSC